MSRSAIALVSVCLLGGAHARANTLDAPAVVVADKTGAFSYEAVFTVKDPVILAGAGVEWSSEDNIVGQPWHGDCLCYVPGCEHDAGEEIVLFVYGSLRNPSENGTVRVWYAFCYTESFYATTTVLPWTLIETVPVGNPGNAGELSGEGAGGLGPDRICGAVVYVYNIGKFEVTAGQYTEFLNAVASEDTYELYNTNMANTTAEGDGYGCNIQRSPSQPYTYSVDPAWADRPVNYVSWGDAARFANWIHNGQPTGDQDLTTTEDGSYYLNGATSDAQLLAIVREVDATWVIPSEDEWYKAAYYDGSSGGYYDYPTGSDSLPVSEACPGGSNSANYGDSDWAVGPPFYRNEVGCYVSSASPYGTFDQGGNVVEWNEAILHGSYRGLRGGSFVFGYFEPLHAASRYLSYPSSEYDLIGFRVAEIAVPDCTHDGDGDSDVDMYDFALYQATFADARCYALFHMVFNGPR